MDFEIETKRSVRSVTQVRWPASCERCVKIMCAVVGGQGESLQTRELPYRDSYNW